MQFERNNLHISLFITSSEGNPLVFTRNNASIQVNTEKIDDYRDSLTKPSMKRYIQILMK